MEVIPDMQNHPCLTMQEVSDGNGGSLLVVYVSGAMTSRVKASAAERLGSKTIKQGPISFTVFGGNAHVNKGSIEAFKLPMAKGRYG